MDRKIWLLVTFFAVLYWFGAPYYLVPWAERRLFWSFFSLKFEQISGGHIEKCSDKRRSIHRGYTVFPYLQTVAIDKYIHNTPFSAHVCFLKVMAIIRRIHLTNHSSVDHKPRNLLYHYFIMRMTGFLPSETRVISIYVLTISSPCHSNALEKKTEHTRFFYQFILQQNNVQMVFPWWKLTLCYFQTKSYIW